jgi:hypothetical protein
LRSTLATTQAFLSSKKHCRWHIMSMRLGLPPPLELVWDEWSIIWVCTVKSDPFSWACTKMFVMTKFGREFIGSGHWIQAWACTKMFV